MSIVQDCGFELIDRSPYSPDTASSDCFLFPNVKKYPAGNRYQADHDVIFTVENFFQGQKKNFQTTKIQTLQRRWKKRVDRKKDYVEK